ncbi:MAG: hypothetical protein U0Q22_02565 [Acidimicrobiales bacterium]
MLLFEQLLASEPLPDVVVFYDGGNEVNAQSLSVKGVPTHVLVDQYAALISGGIADDVTPRTSPAVPSTWRRFATSYGEYSAVRRAASGIASLFGGSSEAGASPRPPARSVYTPDREDVEAAMKVYERGRRLSLHLATEHHVAPVFVWQPTQPSRLERYAESLLTAPTVDLSRAVRGDLFVDGVHTNEPGARMAADALWPLIVDALPPAGRPPSNSSAESTTTSTVAPSIGSAAEQIATASALLEAAAGDPCAVERWKVWLGSLRAETPDDRAKLAALTQRFLDLLVSAAPATVATHSAAVAEVARRLPAEFARADIDPSYGAVPQMPFVDDPASTFPADFEAVSAAVAAGCTAPDAGAGDR